MEKVTIDKLEYLKLQLRDVELAMLECSGVDNWQGYGECEDEDLLKEKKDLEDELKKLKEQEK